MTCHKFSDNLVNPVWFVDDVPVNDTDFSYELLDNKDEIVMKLSRPEDADREVC